MSDNVNQPRISIAQMDGKDDVVERDIGGRSSWSEALFFVTIGYAAVVNEWNGTKYEPAMVIAPMPMDPL